MPVIGMEVVCEIFGGCLCGVCTLSWAVWMVFGQCLEALWVVFGKLLVNILYTMFRLVDGWCRLWVG